MLIIYLVQFLDLQPSINIKKGCLLATMIPASATKDPQVHSIRDQAYKRLILCYVIFFCIGIILFTLFKNLWIIQCFIFLPNLFIYFLWRKPFQDLRHLKKKNRWTVSMEKLYFDPRISLLARQMPIKKTWYLLPFFFLIAGYLPCFYTKRILAIPLWQTVILLSLFFKSNSYAQAPAKLYNRDRDDNLEIQQILKGQTTHRIFYNAVLMTLIANILSLFEARLRYDTWPITVFIILSALEHFLLNAQLKNDVCEAQSIYLRSQHYFSDDDIFYDLIGYKNPYDPRLFVPPRIGHKMMLNRGNPLGYSLWIAQHVLVVLFIFISTYTFCGTLHVDCRQDSLSIEIPFYTTKIHYHDITTIEKLSSLPKSKMIRTNGFAFEDRLYGHFEMEDYNHVLLYIESPNEVIHIKTDQDIFLNLRTRQDTDTLYRQILNHLRKDGKI